MSLKGRKICYWTLATIANAQGTHGCHHCYKLNSTNEQTKKIAMLKKCLL